MLSTRTTGPHSCFIHLRYIDLSNNRLIKKESLSAFRNVPGLKYLYLMGNHMGTKQLVGYRRLVIFYTRWLAGSNRALGLEVRT